MNPNKNNQKIPLPGIKLGISFLLFCSSSALGLFAQSKPNILFICTDELHPTISGFRGNQVVRTPNIDALASQGTHFTRDYVASPVCGPSRAALMTGKYIFRNKTWHNGIAWPEDEANLARKVTDSGYYTALFGKMDCPGVYNKLGFSEEWDCSKRPVQTNKNFRKFIAARNAKGHLAVKTFALESYTGNKFEVGPKDYGDFSEDLPTTDRALRFLNERKDDGKPWMMYVGYNMPHWPFTLPQKYYDMYANVNMPMPVDAKFPNPDMHPALQYFQKWDGLDVPPAPQDLMNALRGYYGMVTCVDDMVGELIAELKKAGMYENTYIIFTADHGDNLGEHGIMGNKHTPLEASVSVPLVITGPGVNRGASVDMPVSMVDLYPTILDMAGINNHDSEISGKNLLPILQGKAKATDRIVLSEWHGPGFPGAWYMLTNKKYKYIWYERDRPGLFDMEVDPHELHDLALDPAYSATLKYFETELNRLMDPTKTAREARKQQGLFSPDGRDFIFEKPDTPKVNKK